MSDLLQSALKLGRNKNIAREEYMVAMGKKEPAAFAVSPASVTLSDITGDTEITLHLSIIKNGYMEIEAFCPDDFLSLSRRVITSDVFPGSTFDLTVTVLENRLHRGKNFTYISFETAAQQVKVPIEIIVPCRIFLDDYNPKQMYADLAGVYFHFRKGAIEAAEWVSKSLEIMGTLDGTDRRSMFMMLYKAQLYIEIESYIEAAEIGRAHV